MAANNDEFLESKLTEAAEHIRAATSAYNEALNSLEEGDEDTITAGVQSLRDSAVKLGRATDRERIFIRHGKGE